jgi:putative membrane protein
VTAPRRTFLSTRTRRALVGATALAWLVTGPGAVGLAAAHGDGDDVQIQNTETVQVYTDATGDVDTKRIYEQLALTGHGDVTFANPVSTDGLRNLDGFDGFDIEDGSEQVSTSVDGQKRMRSVSDFDGDLPLDVSVTYLLDGEEVSPGDIVGASGQLEVKYHVENVTGETQQVEVSDGKGGTVTQSIDVVLPMVGSLTTVLPPSFTDVESDQANRAGDGRGGTKMTFTMTLVPPIGGPTVDFGYQANITDGVIPDATVSALPVSPLESSSLKTAAESYEGGADTGADLTAGAAEIDENLLKLRDGAADLTAGLLKLYAGAGKLSDGLNNDAVPGTQQLADGSTKLADGASRLYAGSGDLVGGLHQLSDGTSDLMGGTRDLHDGALRIRDGASDLNAGAVRLRSGAQDLNDGAVRINNGAQDLSDGAVRANDGAQQVDDGAQQLADGLAQAGSNAPALINGLKQVRDGLQLVDNGLTTMYGQVEGARSQFRAGIDQMIAGIGTTGDPTTLLGGLSALRAGLSDAKTQLDPVVGTGATSVYCAQQLLTEMSQGTPADQACINPALGHPGVVTDATTKQNLYLGGIAQNTGTLRTALTGLRDQLAAQVIPGLTRIMCGLDNTADGACSAATPGVLQGIRQVDGGLTQLINGVEAGIGDATDTPADQTLRGGVNGLQQGVEDLLTGGTTLIGGLTLLSDGAQDLSAGTSQLAAGTQQLADGSTRLANGTIVLADGTRQLADGTLVLTDGTRQLADGTVKLADGTQQLNAGATQLDDGATQLDIGGMKLQAGAQQLSDGSGRLDDGLQQLLAGLTTAADGSNQLRDGLQKASGGAPKISDGATKLSKKGTQKLVDAGSETTVEFGTKYAALEAGADRAHEDAMAFGAPEGAQGLTAYTYEIRGEDGEGTRNWGRGIAGLAVFGLGAGVYALRRRFA